MSDSTKIGVLRATSIAAANAVVRHLKLGAFISEYNRFNETLLRYCALEGNRCVSFTGRTNTGRWVYFSVTAIAEIVETEREFPFEKVYVSAYETREDAPPHDWRYHECTWGEDELTVKTLDQDPHQPHQHRPAHLSDESPDAWGLNYPP